MTKPRFAFYEMVRVRTDSPTITSFNGLLAAVVGRVQNDDGSWGYAIHIYERQTTYSVAESDLVATGEHAKRDDFYSADSIRVSQDGELLE